MFAATLASQDPDRALRWALTVATLVSGSAAAGVVALTWVLASWTADLILALLALWLGWGLNPALIFDDMVVVDVALEPPELELDLVESMGHAEPWEIIGEQPPHWEPPPPEPVAMERAMAAASDLRVIGILGALSSAESGALASLFGSMDDANVLGSGESFSDVMIGDTLIGMGGLGQRGGGALAASGGGVGTIGRGGGGSGEGTTGYGRIGGLGSGADSLRRADGSPGSGGDLRGDPERRVSAESGAKADAPTDAPSGRPGSTLSLMPSGAAGAPRPAPLVLVDERAPASGAWCRAVVNPEAPAAAQIRVSGCDLELHQAVAAEVRRAGRADQAGIVRVQVVPPPPVE